MCSCYAQEILRVFREMSNTTISDALDKLKMKGAVTGILPVFHGARIVGPAFTIKQVARIAEISEFRVTEALDQAKPGDVMTFDVGSYTEASTWGGLASLSAKMKGIEGVVVDGAVRDVDEIREMRFPVFARAVTPITGKGRIATISIDTLIEIGGVEIRPNDLVVGDDNGIVIIPHERVEEVSKIAMEIMANEEKAGKRIGEGRSAAEAEKELKIRI